MTQAVAPAESQPISHPLELLHERVTRCGSVGWQLWGTAACADFTHTANPLAAFGNPVDVVVATD